MTKNILIFLLITLLGFCWFNVEPNDTWRKGYNHPVAKELYMLDSTHVTDVMKALIHDYKRASKNPNFRIFLGHLSKAEDIVLDTLIYGPNMNRFVAYCVVVNNAEKNRSHTGFLLAGIRTPEYPTWKLIPIHGHLFVSSSLDVSLRNQKEYYTTEYKWLVRVKKNNFQKGLDLKERYIEQRYNVNEIGFWYSPFWEYEGRIAGFYDIETEPENNSEELLYKVSDVQEMMNEIQHLGN